MIKIDLHTHSRASSDGGITLRQYQKVLDRGDIDLIAITDHKDIARASFIASDDVLKGRVIVGQEIKSKEGEIIGLFLKSIIEDGLSAEDTVRAIKKQDGFVLIPHPEDKYRSGMSRRDIEEIASDVDAVEVFNGRQLSKPDVELRHWAKQHGLALLACSDAHSKSGLGWTFTMIGDTPKDASDLRQILKDGSKPIYERPPIRAYLAPKLNRIANIFRGRHT